MTITYIVLVHVFLSVYSSTSCSEFVSTVWRVVPALTQSSGAGDTTVLLCITINSLPNRAHTHSAPPILHQKSFVSLRSVKPELLVPVELQQSAFFFANECVSDQIECCICLVRSPEEKETETASLRVAMSPRVHYPRAWELLFPTRQSLVHFCSSGWAR